MALLKTLVAVLLGLTLGAAHATRAEYEVKAAFIYRIAGFVEWPGQAAGTAAPLRLCLLGGNPFGTALDSIRGRLVDGRRLDVAILDIDASLAGCAMLYIAPAANRHLERIVALSRQTGMLTLGDSEGYARRGVMLNFLAEGERVRFEINRDAAQQGGVKISSKLLAIARTPE